MSNWKRRIRGSINQIGKPFKAERRVHLFDDMGLGKSGEIQWVSSGIGRFPDMEEIKGADNWSIMKQLHGGWSASVWEKDQIKLHQGFRTKGSAKRFVEDMYRQRFSSSGKIGTNEGYVVIARGLFDTTIIKESKLDEFRKKGYNIIDFVDSLQEYREKYGYFRGKVSQRIDYTDNFERHRVREPSEFIEGSLRTHDFGRAGFSKRIAGRLRKDGSWQTQSILISHSESIDMKRKLRKQARELIARGR